MRCPHCGEEYPYHFHDYYNAIFMSLLLIMTGWGIALVIAPQLVFQMTGGHYLFIAYDWSIEFLFLYCIVCVGFLGGVFVNYAYEKELEERFCVHTCDEKIDRILETAENQYQPTDWEGC